MTDPTPEKIATFTPIPALREGGPPIYSVVYTRGRSTVGRSLARGDELDARQASLTAGGWSVVIKDAS